jgi:putative FmdB family regulatory protein
MPIYEFRCLACGHLFELLILNDDEKVEMQCPACKERNFERVMSAAYSSMGGRSGANAPIRSQSRTCSGGSCTTYEIPGPTR